MKLGYLTIDIFPVYVDIGAGDMDQGALDFTLDGTMTTGRQFEIKVSQIFCNSPSR